MYKSKKDLPETLRKYLPEKLQDIYLEAYQRAWKDYEEDEGGDLDREGVAHRDGIFAVQKDYIQDENTGKWYHKDELPEEERKDAGEFDKIRKEIEEL